MYGISFWWNAQFLIKDFLLPRHYLWKILMVMDVLYTYHSSWWRAQSLIKIFLLPRHYLWKILMVMNVLYTVACTGSNQGLSSAKTLFTESHGNECAIRAPG